MDARPKTDKCGDTSKVSVLAQVREEDRCGRKGSAHTMALSEPRRSCVWEAPRPRSCEDRTRRQQSAETRPPSQPPGSEDHPPLPIAASAAAVDTRAA